jgi:prepilin-type N-terminal cleavage/methylation domain-containing protein
MKSKGFTLIEHLIVIAIIVILAFALWGAVGPRKAGAHEINHSTLISYLAEIGADYRWGKNSHTLIIINRGTAKWGNVRDACTALVARDSTLSGMQLILQDGTNGTAELHWEGSGETKVLNNLSSTDTAICII